MSINRPDPGESYADFKARRAAWMREYRARGCRQVEAAESVEVIEKLGYVPIERVEMVLSPWTTDEHGNAARQLRGT